MQKAKVDSRFRENDGHEKYKFLPQAVTAYLGPQMEPGQAPLSRH